MFGSSAVATAALLATSEKLAVRYPRTPIKMGQAPPPPPPPPPQKRGTKESLEEMLTASTEEVPPEER
jgi:hypothetical protein